MDIVQQTKKLVQANRYTPIAIISHAGIQFGRNPFVLPKNVILLQTAKCLDVASTDQVPYYLSYLFQTNMTNYLYPLVEGHYGSGGEHISNDQFKGYTKLKISFPGDTVVDKILSFSDSDLTGRSHGVYWGIFYPEKSGRIVGPSEYDKTYDQDFKNNIYTSDFIHHFVGKYPGQLLVILNIGCSVYSQPHTSLTPVHLANLSRAQSIMNRPSVRSAAAAPSRSSGAAAATIHSYGAPSATIHSYGAPSATSHSYGAAAATSSIPNKVFTTRDGKNPIQLEFELGQSVSQLYDDMRDLLGLPNDVPENLVLYYHTGSAQIYLNPEYAIHMYEDLLNPSSVAYFQIIEPTMANTVCAYIPFGKQVKDTCFSTQQKAHNAVVEGLTHVNPPIAHPMARSGSFQNSIQGTSGYMERLQSAAEKAPNTTTNELAFEIYKLQNAAGGGGGRMIPLNIIAPYIDAGKEAQINAFVQFYNSHPYDLNTYTVLISGSNLGLAIGQQLSMTNFYAYLDSQGLVPASTTLRRRQGGRRRKTHKRKTLKKNKRSHTR